MNAAARALADGSFANHNVRSLVWSAKNVLVCCLVLVVLANAFAVVYVKDLNRRLFSDLQSLQQTHDELRVELGQLLLEQTTWATQARIQQIAQQNLNMAIPPSQSIVMVKP